MTQTFCQLSRLFHICLCAQSVPFHIGDSSDDLPRSSQASSVSSSTIASPHHGASPRHQQRVIGGSVPIRVRRLSEERNGVSHHSSSSSSSTSSPLVTSARPHSHRRSATRHGSLDSSRRASSKRRKSSESFTRDQAYSLSGSNATTDSSVSASASGRALDLDLLTAELHRCQAEITNLKQRLSNQASAHEADLAAAVASALDRERQDRDRRLKAIQSASHTAVRTAQEEMIRTFEKRFRAFQASLSEHTLLHRTKMQEQQVKELAAQVTLQEMMLAIQRNEIHALEHRLAEREDTSHASRLATLESRHAEQLSVKEDELLQLAQAQVATRDLLEHELARCDELEQRLEHERRDASQRSSEIDAHLAHVRHVATSAFAHLVHEYQHAAQAWSNDRHELFAHVRKKDDVIARQDDSIARLLFENSQLLKQLQSLGVFSMGTQTHTEYAARITADRANANANGNTSGKTSSLGLGVATSSPRLSSPKDRPLTNAFSLTHSTGVAPSSPSLAPSSPVSTSQNSSSTSAHSFGNVRLLESHYRPIVIPTHISSDPFEFAASLPPGTIQELTGSSGSTHATTTAASATSPFATQRSRSPMPSSPHRASTPSSASTSSLASQSAYPPSQHHQWPANSLTRPAGALSLATTSSRDSLAAARSKAEFGQVLLSAHNTQPNHASSHSISFTRDFVQLTAPVNGSSNSNTNGASAEPGTMPSIHSSHSSEFPSHFRSPSLVQAVTNAYPAAGHTHPTPSGLTIISGHARSPHDVGTNIVPSSFSAAQAPPVLPEDASLGMSSEWKRYQNYKVQTDATKHAAAAASERATTRHGLAAVQVDPIPSEFARRQREAKQLEEELREDEKANHHREHVDEKESLLPSTMVTSSRPRPTHPTLHYVSPSFDLPPPLPTPEELHLHSHARPSRHRSERQLSPSRHQTTATDATTMPTAYVYPPIHVHGNAQPGPPPTLINGLSEKANEFIAQAIQSSLPITYNSQTSTSGAKVAIQIPSTLTGSGFINNSISASGLNGSMSARTTGEKVRDLRGKRLRQTHTAKPAPFSQPPPTPPPVTTEYEA